MFLNAKFRLWNCTDINLFITKTDSERNYNFCFLYNGLDIIDLRRAETFSKETTLLEWSLSASEKDPLWEERICSPWDKFFPLRVDSFSEEAQYAEIQTGCHKDCLPYVKMAEKIPGVFRPLKIIDLYS